MSQELGCSHDNIELIGEEKCERGVNKYFRCLKCRNVLVLSEDGELYEIPAANKVWHR